MLQAGYAVQSTVVVCVQLTPHDTLVTLAMQRPVLLQVGGGGQGLDTRPVAVRLVLVHTLELLQVG